MNYTTITRFCFFILLISVVIYLLLAFHIAKNAEHDNKKQADAILVLGARIYRDNAINPCLVARVEHAVELYKAHYAPKLLVSGGVDKEDNVNEAQEMKRIAMSLGVPESDILLESESTSTYENMLLSKKIINEEHMHSIIIVTEPFHLPRAMLAAEKVGLKAVGSPAMKSMCWANNKYLTLYFAKEPLAIMYYKLRNRV
ncbi:YdcF family protein [Legionella rowbothamii]|uniref:YdcF family protein n=1 Tax=Legionella rowbothamii TaxID=96229 RepID=UPI001055518E|nr:YdcF family protein [Legionella rowbothamii]